jgi:hypothetical protein
MNRPYAVAFQTSKTEHRYYFDTQADMVTAYSILRRLQWVDHEQGQRPIKIVCEIDGVPQTTPEKA